MLDWLQCALDDVAVVDLPFIGQLSWIAALPILRDLALLADLV